MHQSKRRTEVWQPYASHLVVWRGECDTHTEDAAESTIVNTFILGVYPGKEGSNLPALDLHSALIPGVLRGPQKTTIPFCYNNERNNKHRDIYYLPKQSPPSTLQAGL